MAYQEPDSSGWINPPTDKRSHNFFCIWVGLDYFF